MADVIGHDGAIDIKDPTLFSDDTAASTPFLLVGGAKISLAQLAGLLQASPYNLSDDQSGSEIEALLDAELGGTTWKTGGGSGSRNYITLTSGALSIEVAYLGVSPPTLTVNATGDYSVVAQNGVDIVALEIFGNNTTIAGSDFTIRIDNSNNSKDLKFTSQIHNPQNGALVDVFNQSNQHTRTIASNVTTHVYPTMNLFGATGFDITLTR